MSTAQYVAQLVAAMCPQAIYLRGLICRKGSNQITNVATEGSCWLVHSLWHGCKTIDSKLFTYTVHQNRLLIVSLALALSLEAWEERKHQSSQRWPASLQLGDYSE